MLPAFLNPPVFNLLFCQLYREAGYWRCESLKRAIEEQMHLYRSAFKVDSSGAIRRQATDTEVRCTLCMFAAKSQSTHCRAFVIFHDLPWTADYDSPSDTTRTDI